MDEEVALAWERHQGHLITVVARLNEVTRAFCEDCCVVLPTEDMRLDDLEFEHIQPRDPDD